MAESAGCVLSLGIMSNRITSPQVDKIAAWARQLADGKVTLLFDCEATGDDGAKTACGS